MNSDFKKLLRIFQKFSVRYLVVGGYAVMHYSEPRYTKDLDIWIDTEKANAERVHSALTAFGAPMRQITADELTVPYMILQIGLAPVRIDIISGLKGGLHFSSAWSKKETDNAGGVPVHFIAKDDLIRSKKAVGRPQDKADINALKYGKKKRPRV